MNKWYNKNENGKALYVFEEDDITVALDTVAISMLSNNKINCLVPASFSQMDTVRYIKYDISSRIPFRDFVSRPTNFKIVAQLLINMCTGMKDLRRYMIDTDSLLLNVDLMFIDVSIPMLSFIIDPVLDDKKSVDIREFIRGLLMRLQILDNNNLGYIINYINSKSFTTDGFVKELTKLLAAANDPQAAAPSGGSGFEGYVNGGASKPAPKPEPAAPLRPAVNVNNTPAAQPGTSGSTPPVQKQAEKKTLFSGLLGGHGEGKKKPAESKLKKTAFAIPGKSSAPAPAPASFAIPGMDSKPSMAPAPSVPPAAAPAVNIPPAVKPAPAAAPAAAVQPAAPQPQIPAPAPKFEQPAPMPMYDDQTSGRLDRNSQEDNDVTQMMGSNDSDGNAPKLIRVSNAEVIDIDKESFNIGRDPKSLLDYVINDARVSRRHATIMHKGNNYFIVDLGSKNHTYVNGNMLISNMETLINNGDKIRIAFEEFIFEV